MEKLKAKQSLEEEAKNIDFPSPIVAKKVMDFFCYLSEKIPCAIHYNISTKGIVDMSNIQRNNEAPSEITGKICTKDYLSFTIAFNLLNAHIPPFFTGIRFDIYPQAPRQIEFTNIIRKNAREYFIKEDF